ncbi:late transcription elongation factor [Variola virus]|uniref:Late transcription elongation factor OPG087 n=1 Tax=Variola virus TaxID=10255 RepID=Q0N581_VARV|nr:late transcription elongation factor [Variola virus]ABF29258.1 late transcription elongation factor [Variola virus]ABG43234.1 late transcription elongation factor [Variola virus]ABG44247.1 late transcription elongation factor [Variola virus]ABG44451.1 late transcription elongation factor [Variola virus]
MPFRDLILFNLSKFLLTEDKESLEIVSSLCRGFEISYDDLITYFPDRKYHKYIYKVFEHVDLSEELSMEFHDTTLRDLVYLKLYKYSKCIRPCYKLGDNLKGIVVIRDRNIYIREANDDLIEYLLKEYTPQIYTYSNEHVPIAGSKLILCGFSQVTFMAYTTSHITTNKKVDVLVSKKCIDKLVDPINYQILQNLFDKGSGTINKILRKIFYSVTGGQTP